MKKVPGWVWILLVGILLSLPSVLGRLALGG